MADREVGVDEYAAQCVKIEPLALEEEFVRLPGDLAYWNGRFADLYCYWQERKQVTDQLCRVLSIQYRESLAVNTKGRVTIGEVEEQVVLNADYKDAKSKEIQAEVEKIRVQGVVEAIRAKKDMLVSLGAHMRAEMGGDLSVRSQSSRVLAEQKFAGEHFSSRAARQEQEKE